ncbi:porin family protein [Massilia sp. Leaf139]|uniref:porin family protein n=1 Tax=Massilia sp. Leaf139 TaxID=1736272 RepID=UPI0006F284A5|nr:porin family protein [Massilia sp. Leaf139]KQQ91893.1 hypothetical protein ASF77_08160 [Massilia sp. Leaf139]
MFKKIAATAILVITSSTGFAAEPNSFYAGVDLGRTKIDDISGRGTSAGVFVGYNVLSNIAIEAGYRRLASLEYTAVPGINGDIDLNQVSLSAVGTLPLSNGFSLLGRLGYSRVEAEDKVLGRRVKTSDSNGIVGVGVGYAFNPAISARLEFQKPSSDSQNVSIGLAYQF